MCNLKFNRLDVELNNNTCNGCPCVFTDESDKNQNYGCLPDHGELVQMYLDDKGLWACHSNADKVCGGLIQLLKGNNIPFNKNNKLINWDEVHKKVDYSKLCPILKNKN